MEVPVAVNVDANGIVTVPTPASDYNEHLKRLQQPLLGPESRSLPLPERLKRAGFDILLSWIASNIVMVAVVLCVPALSTFKPTKDGGKGFVWVGVVMWSNVILLAVGNGSLLPYKII